MKSTKFNIILICFFTILLFFQSANASTNDTVNWRANWIWCRGKSQPLNFYLYVRKTFKLSSTVKTAKILVAADSRYKLYINGKFVNRGSARCDRRWENYDKWDISKYLHKGKNVIAALVHEYGETTRFYMLGRGGFLCQSDIMCTNGENVKLQTDKSWKVLPASAWERRMDRIDFSLGFAEIYDSRKEPINWTRTNFDDSSWNTPVIVGKPPCEPWPRLVQRGIPTMKDTVIYPVKILKVGSLSNPKLNYYYFHMNFNKIFGKTEYAVVYASTFVWSPKKSNFVIHAGSDDAIRLWINNKVEIDHLVGRGANPNDEIKKVELKAGWNKILVKITNQKGGWACFFQLEGKGSQSLIYSSQPVKLNSLTQNDRAYAWKMIGPFNLARPHKDFYKDYLGISESPTKGGNALIKNVDYSKTYVGKDGKKIAWHLVGDMRKVTPIAIWMKDEKRLPLSNVRTINIKGLINPNDRPATIYSTKHTANGIYALIDFGREVTGHPEIKIDNAHGGEIIDMGYGEVLQDTSGRIISPATNEIGILNPDRDNFYYADRYICRPGSQKFQTFGKRGFRYLQIDIRNVAKPIKIGPVSILFSTYPVVNKGNFECSDSQLNKIWKTGRYTVKLNMADAYTDCPWREQGQWAGDANIEALCNYYAFGDFKLMKEALTEFAESQDSEGVTWGVYPTDNDVKMPTYTMIWIRSLWNYYLFSGDKQLVREIFPNVQKAFKFFSKYLDKNNVLSNVPDWNFIDWAPEETNGTPAAINCLYYDALNAGIKLSGALGDKNTEHKYQRLAEKVKAGINKQFWNQKLGAYEDYPLNETSKSQISQQSNSLAVAFNIAPHKYYSKIFNYTYDPNNKVIQIASPYFAYYGLKAMYKADLSKLALEYIKKNWGRMLNWGATTWWETWNPGASFCHGWSSCPTYYLPQEYLGVKPKTPAWKIIEIKPNPLHLKWAKGTVPSVRGNITVNWQQKTGGKPGFEMTVKIPSNCSAETYVPLRGRNLIKVNGKFYSDSMNKNIIRLSNENGYARFKIRREGKYIFYSE